MLQKLITKIEKAFIVWYDAFRAKRVDKLRNLEWERMRADALDTFDAEDKVAFTIATTLINNIIKQQRVPPYQHQNNQKEADKFLISPIDKVLFNVAVRVIKSITELRQIVSVQPLTGPVGLAFLMVFTGESGEDTPTTVSDLLATGRGRLEVISQAIEARTRKLHAGWSLEAKQDAMAAHGIDLETELTNIIADEIASEVFEEVISDLIKIATNGGNVVTLGAASEYSYDGQEGDQLALTISRVANQIGAATHRGTGNYVIMSPMSLSRLQCSTNAAFVSREDHERGVGFDLSPGLSYVGVLNGKMKVYCSYTIGDRILVGYQGTGLDTGYVYGPYIPVMSAGMVVNPVTFQPAVSFITRYAKLAKIDQGAASGRKIMFNSSNYYRVIDVEVLETALPAEESSEESDATQDVEVKDES